MTNSPKKTNTDLSGRSGTGVIDAWLRDHGDPAIARLVRKNLAVAARITQILVSKDMKPSDLAKQMGKQKSEISKWLSGQHTFTTKTIANIEAALGADIIQVQPLERDVYFKVRVRIPKEEVSNTILFEESIYSGE